MERGVDPAGRKRLLEEIYSEFEPPTKIQEIEVDDTEETIPKRRPARKRKTTKRAPSIKSKLLKKLRKEKRDTKKKLRQIERDIKSLSCRKTKQT